MTLIEGIGDEVIEFLFLCFFLLVGLIAWQSTGIPDRQIIPTILIMERRSRRNVSNSSEQPAIEPSATDPVSNGTNNEESAEHTESEDVQSCDTCEKQEEDDDPPSDDDSIRIRLKYLNDDLKLVDGKLQEQLGNFKRRHFSNELSAQKLVRLIFNGQVLHSDTQTLQDYGLFDNCVVHCLVHAARENTNRNPPPPSSETPQREWDLSNILFGLLSLALGLAWYCRYHYSTMFNATTTLALIGLTGMLTVSIVGIYLPDQDGIRH